MVIILPQIVYWLNIYQLHPFFHIIHSFDPLFLNSFDIPGDSLHIKE